MYLSFFAQRTVLLQGKQVQKRRQHTSLTFLQLSLFEYRCPHAGLEMTMVKHLPVQGPEV